METACAHAWGLPVPAHPPACPPSLQALAQLRAQGPARLLPALRTASTALRGALLKVPGVLGGVAAAAGEVAAGRPSHSHPLQGCSISAFFL